jgi:hypothetical protein
VTTGSMSSRNNWRGRLLGARLSGSSPPALQAVRSPWSELGGLPLKAGVRRTAPHVEATTSAARSSATRAQDGASVHRGARSAPSARGGLRSAACSAARISSSIPTPASARVSQARSAAASTAALPRRRAAPSPTTGTSFRLVARRAKCAAGPTCAPQKGRARSLRELIATQVEGRRLAALDYS